MNLNVPPHAVRSADTSRVDLLLIAEMVTSGARVLDIGCGDGTLLRLLAAKRGVDARGIELSQAGVNSCVAQGLAVIQGDADRVLPYDKTGARLPGLIKDVRLVTVEGGPHAIAWTHADQVNRALLGFLD